MTTFYLQHFIYVICARFFPFKEDGGAPNIHSDNLETGKNDRKQFYMIVMYSHIFCVKFQLLQM